MSKVCASDEAKSSLPCDEVAKPSYVELEVSNENLLSQVTALKEQVSKLNKSITELKSGAETEKNALQAQIEDSKVKIKTLTEQKDAIRKEADSVAKKLKVFEDEQKKIPPSSLISPNHFSTGGQLRSKNGAYLLACQEDGNCCLYVSGHSCVSNCLWSSKTSGKGNLPYRLVMQNDGNLVMYNKKNEAVWACGNNSGKAPFRLDLQDDGNLVAYDSTSKSVWSTSTRRA
eukprot:TRINITY_DN269_c0_g1_i1.p1 TRINITY_DN269_c0_g1~~TRINITY_DN269_c0_g1_i1.p1  ORF type:complete len:230 (+),score=34.59 TRINITY_DN269_c0_g1_i1:95-784(+)